jgi:hypothetical protein
VPCSTISVQLLIWNMGEFKVVQSSLVKGLVDMKLRLYIPKI